MSQTNTIVDAFSGKGSKLALLLNINPGDRVILIGNRAHTWKDEFDRYFSCCNSFQSAYDSYFSNNMTLTEGKCGLVIWDPNDDDLKKGLQKGLENVISIMGDKASLVLFAHNRFSIRRILKRPFNVTISLFSGSKGYLSSLKQSGFKKIVEFLPLPNLENMEEVVESQRGAIQLPSHSHSIMKLLNYFGFYRYFHDDYLYIASRISAGFEQLLFVTQEYLSKKLELDCNISLERFDLRQRGALVLMLQDTVSLRRFVARATNLHEVKEVISRNAFWIERIHLSRNVSEIVKSRVPCSFGEIECKENTIYVEQLMEGILAWKVVNDRHLRQKIFKDGYDFLCDFNSSTSRLLEIDEKIFSELVFKDVVGPQVLSDREAELNELNEVIELIAQYLKNNLLGSKRFVVWGHGDYGYGNIIVNQKSGNMVGVIDWDTGRENELVGIDLINMVIQKHRIENNSSVMDALEDIGTKIIDKGFSVLDSSLDYNERFAIDKHQILELFALFCLRITRRSARYPSLFKQGKCELQWLKWMNNKIQGL